MNSDPLCKNFSSTTQKCKECYPGYNLDPVQLTCFEAPASNIDPNCRKFNNNECVECSFRFFKEETEFVNKLMLIADCFMPNQENVTVAMMVIS